MAKKPSRNEIWQTLAEEMGGVFVMNRRGKPQGVQFEAGPWQVLLDSYTQSNGNSSQTYTRVRAVFRAKDDLRFSVYRKSIFSGLGKALGMKDLEVGMPPLDEAYIVQSNSIGKVQSLLIRREIADPLITLNSGKLHVRRFRKRGLREPGWVVLTYETTAKRDVDLIRLMVKLVDASIQHLGRIGSAETDPVPVSVL
jgi:hypothetical protein